MAEALCFVTLQFIINFVQYIFSVAQFILALAVRGDNKRKNASHFHSGITLQNKGSIWSALTGIKLGQ